MRKIPLSGYIKAIETSGGSIIASFSSSQGVNVHGNSYKLIDLLKNELDFDGILLSDWKAINQLPEPFSGDIEKSINAGDI